MKSAKTSETLDFHLGYNESHLGGLGDAFQSVTQAFSKPISQHDLKTILMQIHPEVTTQKILLVGHSQGSFYVNEMYEYLIAHGVSKDSIAVYQIATPASFVAGGGRYVTSKNDKLINWVRDAEREGNLRVYVDSHYAIEGAGVASALRANIEIPPEAGYEESEYGGHKFSVYMDGASDRIVRDISGALSRLKSTESEPEQCFEAPDADLTYKMQAAALFVADPFFESLQNAYVASTKDILRAFHTAANSRGLGLSLIGRNSAPSGSTDRKSQVTTVSAAFDGPQERTVANDVANEPETTEPLASEEAVVEQNIVLEIPQQEQVTEQSIPTTEPTMVLPLMPVVPGFGGGGAAPAESDPVPDAPADTMPPGTSTLSVADCALSLLAAECLVPSLSVSLSWSAATDATSYGIAANDAVQSTTTTTYGTAVLASDASSALSIVSYDAAGNAATSSEVHVTTITRPLILNEIGWAGAMSGAFDPVHVADQWIEIKNVSGIELLLDDVSVHSDGIVLAPLSGALPSGGILVVEQTATPFSGLLKLVSPFTSLSTTTAQQLALVWNGMSIDESPESSTCASWCAGATFAPIGSNESGVTGLYSVLSMERISDDSVGTAAASWQNTDSYGAFLGGSGQVWGTPGSENSAGRPEEGVYCGSLGLAEADQPYNTTGGCVYLSRFISGGTFGVNRYGGVYRGTVASSTQVSLHSLGKSIASFENESLPADAFAGEEYFFAIWENRSFGNDVFDFNFYFTQGASSTLGITGTPHGNYTTIPWTYAP